MPSPHQEQDTDKVWDMSDLPADLRRQTAASVEHGTLPALRLVSHDWNEAANLAVRHLNRQPECQRQPEPAQVRLIGQRWPNLERLELDLVRAMAEPDQNCRDLVSCLMPLTRLQHLSLALGAALLPEGQEFMLRQTQLLSLRIVGVMSDGGAPDKVLQVIGRLSHLTRLYCNIQPYQEVLAGILQPFQLEPTTDEGVRCLSSLQSLQDLTLINGQADTSSLSGQALTLIGSLHQLTHLSLWGWPMVDTDLAHLTNLQLASLELDTCVSLTEECLLFCLDFTSLHSLRVDTTGFGTPEQVLAVFDELAHDVMPFLTRLDFELSL